MDLLAAHFSTCTELVTTIKGQASLLPCGCSLAATVTSRGFWPQLTRQTTSCSEWLVVRGCSFTLSKRICYLLLYLCTLCLNTASVAQKIQNWMIGLKMKWRGRGRKRSWPNLRFYPVISLAWFRNHKKGFSEDLQAQVRRPSLFCCNKEQIMCTDTIPLFLTTVHVVRIISNKQGVSVHSVSHRLVTGEVRIRS